MSDRDLERLTICSTITLKVNGFRAAKLNTSNPDGLESLDFQMSGNESDNVFSQVFRA